MRDVLSNPEDVHPRVAPELDGLVARALEAGAVAPLEYVGAGAAGVVLCDAQDRAFKVYRNQLPETFSYHEAEADWLRDAQTVPTIRSLVATFLYWDAKREVLVRRCVRGRPAGWGTRGVRAAYEAIAEAMKPLGWGAPEYKEDSFILTEEGGLVLVDAGGAVRRGGNLVAYLEDVLAGERLYHEPLADLAWALRMDMHDGLVPLHLGRALHARLEVAAGKALG